MSIFAANFAEASLLKKATMDRYSASTFYFCLYFAQKDRGFGGQICF